MKPIAFDLECDYSTREGINIDSLGNYNYLRKSPPHTLAVCGEDFEWVGDPLAFDFTSLPADALLVAHNASFDSCWFATLGKPAPRLVNCTANLMAYLQRPRSLENAVLNAFNLILDKDIRKRQNGIPFHTLSPAEQQIFRQYCLNEARCSLALALQYLPQWAEHEQQLSQHTLQMCEKGVPVNLERIQQFRTRCQQIVEETRKKIPWIKDGGSPLSLQQARNACEDLGIPPPKNFDAKSEEFQAWVEKYASRTPFVLAMSDFRQGNRLINILNNMEARIMPNGRMNYSLYYAGAHTGRWTGTGGLNMQNLDKAPFHDVNLRQVIQAPAGRKLMVCDFAQVEARVLQWLVGNHPLLKQIRQGYSIYEAYARQVNLWSAKQKLKEGDAALYAMVKAMVLGLGFGAGAERFRNMAKSQYQITLTLEQAEQRITEFREANPLIVRYWRKLVRAIERALADGQSQLTFRLRSGRPLTYSAIHYQDGQLMAKCGFRPWMEHIWGGLLTENIVSATARDLLAHSILTLTRAGVQVISHTHDELLLEVDSDADLVEIEQLILQRPDWAEDFPLAVESFFTPVYEKR